MPTPAFLWSWILAAPVAEGLYVHGRTHEAPDPATAALAYERLIEHGRRNHVPLWEALGRARLVRPLVTGGRWDEFAAHADHLEADAEHLPAGHAAAVLDMLAAYTGATGGDLERVFALRDRAAGLAADLTPTHRAFYGSRAAQTLCDLGDPEGAWARLVPCLEDASTPGVPVVARDRTRLDRNHQSRRLVLMIDDNVLLADFRRRIAQLAKCDLECGAGGNHSLGNDRITLLDGKGAS